MAAPVWPLARASSRRPNRMSVMMNDAESKYRGMPRPWCMKKPGKSTPATLYRYAADEPRAMSVFMVVEPWRSADQAVV